MFTLKKILVSCVKIAFAVAVLYYGGSFLIVEYARSQRQDVMPPGVPEGAEPGRSVTTAEKEAARKALTREEANRDLAKRHYLAGMKYLQDGKYAQAKDEFTKGRALDPKNADLKAALARVNKLPGPSK